MRDYIEERTLDVANYIIENKCTVRAAATHFNISKSTIHKDICERLPYLNRELACNARAVLEVNKAERHLRGGMATKEKYKSYSRH